MCSVGGVPGLTQEQHLKMSRFSEEVAATTLGETEIPVSTARV
jgi:hypothetical protein